MAGVEAFITWLTDVSGTKKHRILELERLFERVKDDLTQEKDAHFQLRQDYIKVLGDNERWKVFTADLQRSLDEKNAVINTQDRDNDGLRREIEVAEAARSIAEARVDDLRETVRVERERLEGAIAHSRQVEEGLRARLGLIPRSGSDTQPGEKQPVSVGRRSWRDESTRLQQESRKIADRHAEHWQDKIRSVEERDGTTGTTGDSGSEASGASGDR